VTTPSPTRAELRALRLRPLEPGDAEGLLAAWRRAFADVDAQAARRSLDEWRWRFERNPDGAQVLLACDGEGRIVAQFAASGATFELRGERLRAGQAVDSFVDPAWRGLGRSGAFVRTGLAFAERFGGEGPGRSAFLWGLPAPAALRIGSARLGYGFVRSVLALSREAERVRPPAAGALEARAVGDLDGSFDAFFATQARARGAIAVRDARRLAWRFRERPGARYDLAEVRARGRLAGWAALARARFAGREAALLADVLAERDGGALAALVAWAAQCARADALPLIALVPDTSPEFLALQDMGLRVEPAPYTLVARSWRSALDVAALRELLWVTLGDTDLC
jgi:YD repeat-containing protein